MADYYADSSALVKRHVHEAGTAWFRFIELTVPVVERAKSLLERHPLRAYDAVQLASALLTQDALWSAGPSPLTFLAADDRLLSAAHTEGLAVDNPNHHP